MILLLNSLPGLASEPLPRQRACHVTELIETQLESSINTLVVLEGN